jgi:hypothetical protein
MNTADLIAGLKKHPTGYACGLLCLICGVRLYFQSSELVDKQAEYETKSATAALILANVGNSAKLTEQTAEIQALTKEMEGRLMRAGQLAVNLQYFYKLEAENEVKLNDVRQGALAKSTGTKTLYIGVPYIVAVQGSFSHIMAFLQKLENGRHFCRFSSAIIATSGGANYAATQANPDMTLTLNLEILGQP